MDATAERRLSWGMVWDKSIPPSSAVVAFGARAIAPKMRLTSGRVKGKGYVIDRLDILPDRRDWMGKPFDKLQLNAWLNDHLPWEELEDGASRKVVQVDDGRFHLRWTPNGSCGYYYITAWMDGE